MKFFISFVAALAAILLFERFYPAAPINPVLPIPQGQREVNGHGADVPAGPSASIQGAKTQACDQAKEEEAEAANGEVAPAAAGHTYGTAISPEGAVPVAQLNQLLGTKDSAQVKLVGKASAVCQAKGCWMTLPTADGQEMRVRFKDYAFFVPKDISGHEVVVSGWAHRSTVSKAEQQHYAKDAGKSEKEIAAITADVHQVTFMADGVLIKN